MLKKILIGLAAVIVLILVIAAIRPAEYTVSRTASIAASSAKVFALVNNIRKWNDWSPWAKLDPSQTVSYEGPASGVGAVQIWEGKKTGSGTMKLVKSEPNKLVAFAMEFRKPMAGLADVEFTFAPEGKGTSVTWAMTGKHNFIGKVMGLFMSMDRMIGGMFEQGLESLGSLAAGASR